MWVSVAKTVVNMWDLFAKLICLAAHFRRLIAPRPNLVFLTASVLTYTTDMLVEFHKNFQVF
jgi:hypothetical protein